MDITFVQTADPIFYYRMLHETSRTVRQYCILNGLQYESYVGIKRGTMPWHSAYNRVYMLKELIERGHTGWVFYLDADAYIHDMNFDVKAYIDARRQYAGIFAGFCDLRRPYDINSGGFALNLGTVIGRQLALDYWGCVDAIPDGDYNRAVVWGKDIKEDQLMLFQLLEDYVVNRGLGEHFLFEQSNESFVNQGPFIRQSLRSHSADFPARLEGIRAEVNTILHDCRDARGDDGPGYYLRADHPRISTDVGERKLGEIRSTGRAGLLTYGPYVPMRAGNYVARVFGEARPARDGATIRVTSDVASDQGTHIWTEHSATLAEPQKGILSEMRFALSRDVDQLELRVSVDSHQDVRVHAIQIRWTDPWVSEA